MGKKGGTGQLGKDQDRKDKKKRNPVLGGVDRVITGKEIGRVAVKKPDQGGKKKGETVRDGEKKEMEEK